MTQHSEGKGRPTPKRSEAQKRRGGPVPPPPANRREAARAMRARRAEERLRQREGRPTAPARPLPARDAGPIRKLVRDVVDARGNLGWLLLPSCVVYLAAPLLTDDLQIRSAAFGFFTATFLAVALDVVILRAQLKRRLRTEFPAEAKVGSHLRYGMLRSTVIRRARMPRPQVRRGQRV